MATIIRKHGAASSTVVRMVQPVEFSFDDMNDRANEYLESVRREAAKIVQQAHQQAEQVRRQAEPAGRASAEAAARKMLDDMLGSRLSTLMPALEKLIAELDESKADWLRQWEQSALAVSAAIAERVIRRELVQRPEISLDWIREAPRSAAGAAEITLHLNPADSEDLGSQLEGLTNTLGR